MDSPSTEIFPQIVIGLAITAAIFFVFLVVEQMWRAYLSYGSARIAVYPYTGSSAKTIIIKQDPANPKSKTKTRVDTAIRKRLRAKIIRLRKALGMKLNHEKMIQLHRLEHAYMTYR